MRMTHYSLSLIQRISSVLSQQKFWFLVPSDFAKILEHSKCAGSQHTHHFLSFIPIDKNKKDSFDFYL